MKDIVINNLIKNISKENKYNQTKLQEIKYGLEALYLTITKMIVIIIICILFKTIKELLLFTIAFTILRCTSFGLHTKKSYQCWITSLPLFTLIPYLIKNVAIPHYMLYLLPAFLITIMLYAPADTEKRPLINQKKRKIYKIITSITSSVYIFLIFFLNNSYLTSVLYYSLLLDVLVINPLSYKLLGLKYNNYKERSIKK